MKIGPVIDEGFALYGGFLFCIVQIYNLCTMPSTIYKATLKFIKMYARLKLSNL